MEKDNTQIATKVETQGRQNVLLKMHEFYSQEARHQRAMMWETVKWSSIIIAAITGALVHFLPDYLRSYGKNEALIIFNLSFVGWFTCMVCVSLIRSFYKTNLKYITMFSKVEDDLEFDLRFNRKFFPKDEYFTWNHYRENRMKFSDSEDLVRCELSYFKLGMYSLISWVFFFIFFIFLILSFFTLSIWAGQYRSYTFLIYLVSVVVIICVFYQGALKKI